MNYLRDGAIDQIQTEIAEAKRQLIEVLRSSEPDAFKRAEALDTKIKKLEAELMTYGE